MSEVARTPVLMGSYIGLDLSLTATGFALKCGQNITLETIKTEPKNFLNDLVRIVHIRDTLLKKIPTDVKLVCVEDFFTPRGPQIGSAIRIAMLGTAVRLALHERKISFFVVSPTSLKKFITGKGVGEKSLILREVFRRYGVDAKNDNEADGCTLAFLAESVDMARNGIDQENLIKPQKEVVSALLASAGERGYNL
jgi:Holliday junction resolvasome RuvABC endonuclease subunit